MSTISLNLTNLIVSAGMRTVFSGENKILRTSVQLQSSEVKITQSCLCKSTVCIEVTWNIIKDHNNRTADSSGCAIQSLGLRPFACWDFRFESRRGHGGLSLVSVVCCWVQVSATGRSLVQSSPTEKGAPECDLKT
jgi:hypothetical protein